MKVSDILLNDPNEFNNAVALVRSLIEQRIFRKDKLEDQDVKKALEVLGSAAKSGPEPALRLEAVSVLAKAGEISKPIASIVHDLIRRGIEHDLPCVGSWGNAEDRYYLARGISVSKADWIKDYAAREFACAELSEKLSRAEWAGLAINRADNLADALNAIGKSLAAQLAGVADHTDLAYRKLIRICESLTQTLLTVDIPAGKNFGKAFLLLISQAGGGTSAETLKLREEAALSALDLLIQILRLRFETIFDSDLFRAAGAVRSWWKPARPPEDVEKRTDRIAKLALDGLHILARQGLKDIELRRTLVSTLGQSRINSIGQLIASNDISLDPDISRWLASGQDNPEGRSNKIAQELNELALDELIAQLLITLHHQDANPQTLKVIADQIDTFEPNIATAIRSSSNKLEIVVQWVQALASKRMLSTYGKLGELIQYDPAQHESRSIMQRMSQARIVSPGVIRLGEGRPAVIILKAIVDKT